MNKIINILILLRHDVEISDLSPWQELHTLIHLEFYYSFSNMQMAFFCPKNEGVERTFLVLKCVKEWPMALIIKPPTHQKFHVGVWREN